MKTFGEKSPVESTPSDDPAPLEVLQRGETTNRILDLYGTLSDNQQEVLRLKFQNDLSYKEISRITDLTVSNVGYLIHTGLKTIRARIQADSSMPSKA